MGVGSRPGLPIPRSRFLFATAVFCLALWPAPHASPLGIHGDDWKWTQSAPHRRNADAPADGHGTHHAWGGLISRLRDWEARGPTEGGFRGGHSTWDGGDDDTSSGQQPGSGRLSSQRSAAFNPPAMLLGARVPRGSLIGRRPGGQMPSFVPGFGASQKSKAALRMLELRGDKKTGTGIRWKMPSFGTSSVIAMGAVRGQRAESGDVERRENGHDGGDGAKSRTRSSVRSRSPRPPRSDRRGGGGGGGGGGGTRGGMRSGSSLSALRGDEDVEELMAWADRCLGIDTHDRGARDGGGRAGGKEGIARNAVAACYAMNRLKHTPEGNYGMASLSKVVALGLEAQIDVGYSSRMTGMQISLALNAAAGKRSGGNRSIEVETLSRLAADAILSPDQLRGEMDARTLAMLLHSFAELGLDKDTEHSVTCRICNLATVRPPHEFQTRTVAMLSNAVAKLGGGGESTLGLEWYIRNLAVELDASGYTLQDVANIANAASRLEWGDERLAMHMADAVLSLSKRGGGDALRPKHKGDMQCIAVLCNAAARGGVGTGVLPLLFQAVLGSSMSLLTPQSAALIANSRAKAAIDLEGGSGRLVMEHVSSAVRGMPPSKLTPRDSASLLNAYTRLGYEDEALFLHIRSSLLLTPRGGESAGSRNTHNLQTLATTMSSYASAVGGWGGAGGGGGGWLDKGEIEGLFERLSADVMALPESQMRPVGVSMVLNSLAKAGMEDKALIHHLSSSIMSWPNKTSAGMSAHTISTLVSAAVRLKVVDADVWSRLFALASLVPYFDWDATSAARTLQALARIEQNPAMKARVEQAGDGEGMAAFVRHVEGACLHVELSDLTIETCAQILHGASVVGIASPLLFRVFFARAALFPPQDVKAPSISMLITALSSCGEGRALAAVRASASSYIKACVLECGQLSALEMAIISSGLAKAGIIDPRIFRRMVRDMKQQSVERLAWPCVVGGDEGVHPLTVLFGVLSRIGHSDYETYNLVAAGLMHAAKRGHLSFSEVSLIANSAARAGYEDEALMSILSELAAKAYPIRADDGDRSIRYSGPEIAGVLNAFARLGCLDLSFFRHMGFVVRGMMPEDLTLHESAMIVNAFSKLAGQETPSLGALRSSVISKETLELFKHMGDTIRQQLASPSAYSASLSVLHHHFDGTVHSHPGGLELHEHHQGTLRGFGVPAPSGGKFVRYTRPSGFVVNVGDAASPPESAICPLLVRENQEASVQNLAVIANAFAKSGVRDDRLFDLISLRIIQADTKAFRAVGVSTLMHAVAAIGISDADMMGTLTRIAMRLPPPEYTPQAVANMAWAAAVLNVGDAKYLRWLIRMISTTVNEMDASCLRQVHQFYITLEQEGHEVAAASLGRAEDALIAFQGLAEREIVSSRLQRDTVAVLRGMGEVVVEEWLDQETGYSLDILLPERNTVIEVDGPYHYAAASRVPLGSTVMKRRHVQRQGMSLIVVPFWEWQHLLGDAGCAGDPNWAIEAWDVALPAKEDYLRRLLDAASS